MPFVPAELTIISATALLAGLLLVSVTLAGRRAPFDGDHADDARHAHGVTLAGNHLSEGSAPPLRDERGPEPTLRVAWWLTIAIVLLGVGISGSFGADQGPIFMLGAGAVGAVVVFHELITGAVRSRWLRIAEVMVAVALVAGLLVLTGYAASPFAMLFALVAVATALAHGPRAGLATAGLATVAFALVLLLDPRLTAYGADDALRLSIGLGATWLLAFVAIAYARRERRTVARAIALSRTDPLTGLFNRLQLMATLDQEISRTRRSDRGFCVLMIDLDGLKRLNDGLGHLRGDEAIRSVGNVIRQSIRAVDSAYRYGGDEFVVLLPETDIVGAFVVAEKVRLGAEEVGLTLGDGEAVTSVSIGLVSHPEDGFSAEDLLTAADRAMYQAKKLGKNQISGNPRPRPALLARRSTIADAASAPIDVPEAPTPAPTAIPAAEPPMAAAPSADRAVAVELGPVVPPTVSEEPRNGRGDRGDEDADPQEVRRQIAAARRSFDPDHQIRRAMDAFLTPAGGEGERPTPDA